MAELTNRQRLFAALNDLDDEIGDIPGLGRRSLRRQAVIDVVNALYPKPNTSHDSKVVLVVQHAHA